MYFSADTCPVVVWAPRDLLFDGVVNFTGGVLPSVGDVVQVDKEGPLVVAKRWFAPHRKTGTFCWHLVFRLPDASECVPPWGEG